MPIYIYIYIYHMYLWFLFVCLLCCLVYVWFIMTSLIIRMLCLLGSVQAGIWKETCGWRTAERSAAVPDAHVVKEATNLRCQKFIIRRIRILSRLCMIQVNLLSRSCIKLYGKLSRIFISGGYWLVGGCSAAHTAWPPR